MSQQTSSERRRYFRIKDMVVVSYAMITEKERDEGIEKLRSGSHCHTGSQTLLGLETQINSLLSYLKEDHSEIAYGLELLNAKINVLAANTQVPEKVQQQFNLTPSCEVDLSACGMAFSVTDPVEVGQHIALEMVLYPSHFHMILYGVITLCQKQQDDTYRLAIDFEGILDDDREKLIQHVLKKQSEELKAKRIKSSQKS